MVKGLRERELIRETLGRFVPEKVASSLLSGGGDIPVQQTEATILFCDIEAFTRLTETLGPVKIVDVLNAFFSAMVEILERHGGVVTQFQGDAILATFNVPIADDRTPLTRFAPRRRCSPPSPRIAMMAKHSEHSHRH